jgi:hypothetical protein
MVRLLAHDPRCLHLLTWNSITPGKLCGAFLIDEAFESYIRYKSKLKVSALDRAEYGAFVSEDWEMGVKRHLSGDPIISNFFLRPPAKAFTTLARLKGDMNFSLSR